MYARVTTYRFDPARHDEMVAKIDGIKAQVAEISGVVHIYTAWRLDGNGVTTSIYENQAAADAATEQVRAIWGGLADLLAGPPNIESYDNVARMSA